MGVIDKLYGCFLYVQGPVDESPKMSAFLEQATALLHAMCKLCFAVNGRWVASLSLFLSLSHFLMCYNTDTRMSSITSCSSSSILLIVNSCFQPTHTHVSVYVCLYVYEWECVHWWRLTPWAQTLRKGWQWINSIFLPPPPIIKPLMSRTLVKCNSEMRVCVCKCLLILLGPSRSCWPVLPSLMCPALYMSSCCVL